MTYKFLNLIRTRAGGARYKKSRMPTAWDSLTRLLVVLLGVAVGGCASLPAENGRGNVDQLLLERGRLALDADVVRGGTVRIGDDVVLDRPDDP